MNFLDELKLDLNTEGRIIIQKNIAIIENIRALEELSDSLVIVACKNGYVSILGKDMEVKMIGEGRLIVGGDIQKAEFL